MDPALWALRDHKLGLAASRGVILETPGPEPHTFSLHQGPGAPKPGSQRWGSRGPAEMYGARSGAAEGPTPEPAWSLSKVAKNCPLLNVHTQPGIEWPGAWASSGCGFKSQARHPTAVWPWLPGTFPGSGERGEDVCPRLQ